MAANKSRTYRIALRKIEPKNYSTKHKIRITQINFKKKTEKRPEFTLSNAFICIKTNSKLKSTESKGYTIN